MPFPILGCQYFVYSSTIISCYMARFIPLFPLNIVVFPGEKLNLHIFEPRYKQLVNECYATGTTFGTEVALATEDAVLRLLERATPPHAERAR